MKALVKFAPGPGNVDVLDVEDVVTGGSYTLEVSSPGLDRSLSRARDFEKSVGNRMKVTTRDPVNGNRHFEGRLVGFSEDRLTVDLDQMASRKKAKDRRRSLRDSALTSFPSGLYCAPPRSLGREAVRGRKSVGACLI